MSYILPWSLFAGALLWRFVTKWQAECRERELLNTNDRLLSTLAYVDRRVTDVTDNNLDTRDAVQQISLCLSQKSDTSLLKPAR